MGCAGDSGPCGILPPELLILHFRERGLPAVHGKQVALPAARHCFEQRVQNRDLPNSGLCFRQLDLWLVRIVVDTFGDIDFLSLEIEVLPCECQRLTLPQAGIEQ